MHPVLKPVHIMLDNKTLSILPNAHIAQSAMVHFCPDTFEVLDTKVITMKPEAQPGAHVDVGTVYYWMKQPWETQQSVFNEDEEHAVPIQRGCSELYRFIIDACRREWEEDETPSLTDLRHTVHIWAKPAHFDIPQWDNAFRHAGVQVPWHDQKVNCVMSLINQAKARGFDPDSLPEVFGVHQPLNDCLYQIGIIKAITEFDRK